MSKFDRRYLEMAEIWAKNSYCKRRQVGALLVKNVSDGVEQGRSNDPCSPQNQQVAPE